MRYTGRVKWYNESKNFGFITPEDGQPDIFFHRSALKNIGFKAPAEGDRVEYDISNGPNGHVADNLTIIQ